jgi:hypothetical protein
MHRDAMLKRTFEAYYICNILKFIIKSWKAFMERDNVAPPRKVYAPLASLPAFGWFTRRHRGGLKFLSLYKLRSYKKYPRFIFLLMI